MTKASESVGIGQDVHPTSYHSVCITVPERGASCLERNISVHVNLGGRQGQNLRPE
jgi:hypothetical protein